MAGYSAMEFVPIDERVVASIAFLLLALAPRSLGSDSIDELLKKHPTWSFEVENVETFIEKSLREHSLRGLSRELTEKILRDRVRRSLPPGATHIVRKIGDPKWETDPSKVPSEFDVRQKWKDCAPLIEQVEDEGPCLTDTPAVISSVLSDRYCISTNGTYKERFSQEMLLGCAGLCTSDPFIFTTWSYARDYGVATGGIHGSGKGCVPYTYPGCDHKSNYDDVDDFVGHGVKNISECKGQLIFDHDCPNKCTNEKHKTPIDKDRKRLTTFYMTSTNEFSIRNEILAYGPVVTSVVLFSDFLEKPVGIFHATYPRKLLAFDKFFKIIGWGKEGRRYQEEKYWLCVNTWDTWGDKIFKIPRGRNYDFVESTLTAGVFDDID